MKSIFPVILLSFFAIGCASIEWRVAPKYEAQDVQMAYTTLKGDKFVIAVVELGKNYLITQTQIDLLAKKGQVSMGRIKFKKRYIIGEGYPNVRLIFERVDIDICNKNGKLAKIIECPKELVLDNKPPKYRLILERI